MAQSYRMLVVDDDEGLREYLEALASSRGFQVFAAQSGEEAVALAADLRPDLVLMDINMPGINGLEATARIVADAPDAVVFLCSTYERSDLPD